MAKLHTLVSPFGELTVRQAVDHSLIQASSPLAADWGLGWWHAHAAGDEAVFTRAFWRSQLSAGPRPTAAQTEMDSLTSAWGMAADGLLETSNLPAGHRSRVQAYVQGFNQGRRRRPGEALWTPEDCHLLVRTLGFLEWWETRYPELQFLHQAWQAGLAWPKLTDLWPALGPTPPVSGTGSLPPLCSPEARALVDRIRRFRGGRTWLVPGSRSPSGRALLGGQFVSDVTEPGLPLLPVRVDTADGSVRGLSRPGHPGFLAGVSGRLAWQASVAVDDTVDLRLLGTPGSGLWAGSGKTGTLGGLLALEDAETVDQAREMTAGHGTASLDLSVVDSAGQAAQWAMGCRWRRARPRDQWLAFGGETDLGIEARRLAEIPSEGRPRMSPQQLQETLVSGATEFAELSLAPLRFLIPETEAGMRLRRWTGSPGPEAQLFERLYAAVLAEFWASSPVVPDAQSPVAQSLAPVVDRLVRTPHSEWLPSPEKNRRLADAVRRAFSLGPAPAPSLLASRAVRSCWTEVHGGRKRIFAATVAFVAEAGADGWDVFLTDDETEVPLFHHW